MLVELSKIIVPPGHQVLLKDVTWTMYQKILENLGENRNSKVSYSQGILEIMTPLPEHEVGKVIIGDLVKALLEELNLDFWSLGSTTFESESTQQGVEPDDCFYIQNEAAVRGKRRIDLKTDPPPDLAIEIDITSRTRFNNYEALGVPELWRWDGRALQISVLQGGEYFESAESRQFPDFPIREVIPQYLERCQTDGRNATMRAFRAWVREKMQK